MPHYPSTEQKTLPAGRFSEQKSLVQKESTHNGTEGQVWSLGPRVQWDSPTRNVLGNSEGDASFSWLALCGLRVEIAMPFLRVIRKTNTLPVRSLDWFLAIDWCSYYYYFCHRWFPSYLCCCKIWTKSYICGSCALIVINCTGFSVRQDWATFSVPSCSDLVILENLLSFSVSPLIELWNRGQ